MTAAKRDKRLSSPTKWDSTTMRIEHNREFTPLGRRIYGEERPSDIIRICTEIKKHYKP